MSPYFFPEFPIIDAHAHLWDHLHGNVNGYPVESLGNGQSTFNGSVRLMMPPYMLDGRNNAEMFLANMDYAGVTGSVITQEYIDGDQNDYLQQVKAQYPNRFFPCGLAEFRSPGYFPVVQQLIERGFLAIKVPAQWLVSLPERVNLTESEMMDTFKLMEETNTILSIDLAEGDLQVNEMQTVIDTYPKLKIALGHFGMVNRPNWDAQLLLAQNEHVMLESGGITWLFHSEFYPYEGAIKAIRHAIERIGIEKIMWGSDYPRTMTAITYKMAFDFILKSDLLSDDEKIAFLGGNAIRFYGFENLPELNFIQNMVED